MANLEIYALVLFPSFPPCDMTSSSFFCARRAIIVSQTPNFSTFSTWILQVELSHGANREWALPKQKTSQTNTTTPSRRRPPPPPSDIPTRRLLRRRVVIVLLYVLLSFSKEESILLYLQSNTKVSLYLLLGDSEKQ